jgi:hypothetical protein
MTFHDAVSEGNTRDKGSVLFNLFVLEELGRDHGTDKNLGLVVGLQGRRHLLILNDFNDLSLGRLWILLDVLACPVNGKFEGTRVVNASLRSHRQVVVAAKAVILLLTKNGVLEIILVAIFVVFLVLLFILVFVLLLILILVFVLLFGLFVVDAIATVFVLLFLVALFILNTRTNDE